MNPHFFHQNDLNQIPSAFFSPYGFAITVEIEKFQRLKSWNNIASRRWSVFQVSAAFLRVIFCLACVYFSIYLHHRNERKLSQILSRIKRSKNHKQCSTSSQQQISDLLDDIIYALCSFVGFPLPHLRSARSPHLSCGACKRHHSPSNTAKLKLITVPFLH